MGKRFWQIFAFSLLAGVLTAFAFSAGFSGKVDLGFISKFYQSRWLEILVVIISGIISGAIINFWAYFCLWDKNLVIILPMLYISGVAATIFLSTIFYRFYGLHGGFILGLFAVLIFWVLALLLAKFFAPENGIGKCRS